MPRPRIDLQQLVNIGRISGGYFVTTTINQALPFLILPILTRYLTTAEYGVLALFSLYLLVSNSLTGVSIPAVISKHFFRSEKQYIAEIIGNSLIINAGLCLITMAIAALAYLFFPGAVEIPLRWLLVIPLASFSFVIFNIGLNVMKNTRSVWTFGRHQIGNTALNIGFSLLLIIVFMWGWQGRAAGIMTSYFLSAIFSLLYLKRHGYIAFRPDREQIREILKVVLPLIPNSVQSVIISQVGIFFIQYYFTKDLLGVYAIGYQIAFVVKLLITAIALSWAPHLWEQITQKSGFDRLKLAKSLWGLLGVLIVGALFVNGVSELVLRVMTTPAYFGAEEFIWPLTVGFVFHGMYVFIMPILISSEQQRYVGMVSFINMLLMIGLNVWLVDVVGYMGVAYAFALTYFAMFLMLFWRAYRIFPLPWGRALRFWR